MELKGRNLRVHMKGDDVEALQRTGRRLGFAITGEVERFCEE